MRREHKIFLDSKDALHCKPYLHPLVGHYLDDCTPNNAHTDLFPFNCDQDDCVVKHMLKVLDPRAFEARKKKLVKGHVFGVPSSDWIWSTD